MRVHGDQEATAPPKSCTETKAVYETVLQSL